MALDIDSFKSDLETLKNQRSVIQAKYDEALRHIADLNEQLKVMGFNSVDEAKQAYLKQVSDAESQHALVKQLIQEISQVDENLPSREEIAERLNSLSAGDFNVSETKVQPIDNPILEGAMQPLTEPADTIEIEEDEEILEDAQPKTNEAEGSVNLNNSVKQTNNNGNVDLGSMLFASL